MTKITPDYATKTGAAATPKVPKATSTAAFVAACLVLAVPALALFVGGVQYLKIRFQKEPVPLRVELKEGLPATLANWVQVSWDEPLKADIEDALGTKQYVFRDYVDVNRLKERQDLLDAIKSGTWKRRVNENGVVVTRDEELNSSGKRKQLLSAVQQYDNLAVMTLAVTYYTGMVDTVAHIPDRCYVADGYVPTSYQTQSWKVWSRGEPEPRDYKDVDVRVIDFEDQTGTGKVNRTVAYLFHANGSYESDPLAVRRSLQDLRKRYGYYAKVELMMIHDPRKSVQPAVKRAEVMQEFLKQVLPSVDKCLPDWNEVLKNNVDTKGVVKASGAK